jgi:acyl-CoA synthetase (AMP-forming)/AMP-acid ligase II
VALASAARARHTPEEPALRDDRQVLTWRALDEVLNRAANALLTVDLSQERRIAVFAENAVETVVAHLAAVLVGVSSVPVSFHLTAAEVAVILEGCRAAVVFVGPETAERGRDAAAATDRRPLVVGWRCGGTGVLPWTDWLARGRDVEPPADMPPRPFLHYTSGTTGHPKAVESPPTMFAGGATVREHFEKLAPDPLANRGRGPNLVVGPLYHTGPLTSVRVLATGVPLVVLGRFDAERTLWAIETFRVSSAVMVPTHFQRLLALPDAVRQRYDVSSVEQLTHTGAACPVDVKRRMIEWFGPVLFEAYGATESGTTNAITSADWLRHPGSVGRALPPFEIVVVDDAGAELGPGEVGRIYFRDGTGRGIVYHDEPAKTAAAHLRPGVFTLGEIGYCDADGFLYITDRASDLVVSGGVNIYPAEAERVLLEHPAVVDAAVIGVPDASMGEQLRALVVLAPGAELAPEELDRFCRDRLAGYKCPRGYEFVADLGRSAMGKLDKRALRAPYWPTDRTIGG